MPWCSEAAVPGGPLLSPGWGWGWGWGPLICPGWGAGLADLNPEHSWVPCTLTFLAFLPPAGAIFLVSRTAPNTDEDGRGERFPLRSLEPWPGSLYPLLRVWVSPASARSNRGLGRGTRPPALYPCPLLLGNLY